MRIKPNAHSRHSHEVSIRHAGGVAVLGMMACAGNVFELPGGGTTGSDSGAETMGSETTDGTSGGLDDLAVDQVPVFEAAFLEFMSDSHPDVADAIAGAKKDIPDDAKDTLNQAIATVKAQISAG